MKSLLHQREGRLTRELLLAPGKFGLARVPARLMPESVTNMVCGYCSTGCGLTVHLQDGAAVNVTPAVDYPVNLGMACPKGWEALAVLGAPDRAALPLLRRNSRLEPVDWDTALQTFVDRFKGIQRQHGNESVAFLSTGQVPTEEMALLGAVAKFGMGLRHGDGNTRQCMATAVVAYQQSFGFDAPPYTYKDFEESDVIVLIGSNLCIAHPILWERVMLNRRRPEIIVIDPRATETSMQATQHLPLAPKSDQTLFYGIARLLIESGWIDRDYIDAHTVGFDAFAEFVQAFDIERVAEETGLPTAVIERCARSIGTGERVSLWWTMGVNQSHQGVRTAQAIVNLALMTGNLGRPGTGANSITGQCNAMGSRLFSNTTCLFGGRDFANSEHRREVADVLGIDAGLIPGAKSWAYNEIIESVLRGRIKGLWVVCTNTAHSWINQNHCRDVLDRLEFLVVQDMYHTTETAQRADLVLPAAGWGEKDGTFINSERRFGLVKKVARAPGQALADFSIFQLIAERWGCGKMFARWKSPEAVFQILKELSRGRPCDFTGIRDYRMLDECEGIQWPYPERGAQNAAPGAADIPEGPHSAIRTPHSVESRLFEDGRFYHSDGKARFVFEEPRPLPERPTERYPLLLLSGRGSASQWHTQTRTQKSGVLRKLHPEGLHIEINPADARRLAVAPGDLVRVESQRGALHARAFPTPSVQPGQVFLPMHDAATNRLTDSVFDPYSKQPAYKACAVRIHRVGGAL